MKKTRYIGVILIILIVFSFVFIMGCSKNDNKSATVVDIYKSKSDGLLDTYTITFSDGSTSTFTVQNGYNGSDGKNGESINIDDVFNKYKEIYGDISYKEFLELFLNIGSIDNSSTINKCLSSCLKVYTEFKSASNSFLSPGKKTEVKCGSAVIYKIDEDYTYVITNYHVVYSLNANQDNNENAELKNIASKIVGYLYGSESNPVAISKDDLGYTTYDYGNYGIEFEYVGGAIDYDIAIIKTSTEDIKNINENIKAVEFADEYYVGETAIAIGNPENEGISSSQGIVSVDNEYITLAIDNTQRSYRSIRIDTAIYGGSSGGGLFNSKGKLIGITNAGNQTDQNINYAIPLEIVKSVTENILSYYDGSNFTKLKKMTLGVMVTAVESKYSYNESVGYGKISEKVKIESVNEGTIAKQLGLNAADIIKSISVTHNENKVEYVIDRYFEIGDILIGVRAGDKISIKYIRENVDFETIEYIVKGEDVK